MEIAGTTLTSSQLRLLETIFTNGAEDASRALSKWLHSDIQLFVGEVASVPLARATEILGSVDELVVACLMGLEGRLTGQIVFAIGDEVGLSLVDLLLCRPVGTETEWTELAESAVMETANIVCCSYLSSLMHHLPERNHEGTVTPTPPQFIRDYIASLLQALFIEQAMTSDNVLLVRNAFERDQKRFTCHLLFVPDASCLAELAASLGQGK